MRKKLAKRMSMDDIHEICFLAQGERNDGIKAKLYDLTFDNDNRVALNEKPCRPAWLLPKGR